MEKRVDNLQQSQPFGQAQDLESSSQESPDQELSDRRVFKWSKEENYQYALFLQGHIEQFGKGRHRRSARFFINMANFLKNGRNNEQCRSHHQKMVKKYGTIKNLIRSIKSTMRKLDSSPQLLSKPTTALTLGEEGRVEGQEPASYVEMILLQESMEIFKKDESSFFSVEELQFLC